MCRGYAARPCEPSCRRWGCSSTILVSARTTAGSSSLPERATTCRIASAAVAPPAAHQASATAMILASTLIAVPAMPAGNPRPSKRS